MFEKSANDTLDLFGESLNSKEIEKSQAHMGVMISSFKLVEHAIFWPDASEKKTHLSLTGLYNI